MRFFIVLGLLIFVSSVGAEEKPKEFFYDDHGKRDPFWILVNPSGVIMNYDTDMQISDLVLEGIILGKGKENLAIINNTIVKPADKIGPFVVGSIEQDKVFLIKGQENFVLRIKKEE